MIKKLNLVIIVLFIGIQSFSQISYEKGYVISNSGVKQECLIKNIDWKNNPTEFEYKFSDNDNAQIGSLESVKEFGVDNLSRYVKFTGGVDRTSRDLDNFNYDKKPLYKSETLFLKVLYEGKVTFFAYQDGNLNLYFYQDGQKEIQQLVNRPYYVETNKIAYFEYYKQQLVNSLICDDDLKAYILKAGYNKTDLLKVFTKYSKCKGENTSNYLNENSKTHLNFTIRPGVVFSSFGLERENISAANVDFGNKTNFRIGVEIEYVLPFNKNKWSIGIEPSYESYKSEKKIPTYGVVSIDFKEIKIPIAVRHYLFLNDKSKLFINLAYSIDVGSKSKGEYQYAYEFEVLNQNSILMGVGYNYNKKYSVELRSSLNSNRTTNYSDLSANYNAISLIFGYTIFNKKI